MNKRREIQAIVDKASTLLRQNSTSFNDIYNCIIANNPKDTSFIYHEYSGNVREFKYYQYDRFCVSAARKLSVLLAEQKIRNSIVGLKINNSPAWCFIFWGLLMSGYRPLLIDDKLPKINTQNILDNAHAIAIITDDKNKYDNVVTLSKDEINDISEDLNFIPNWTDEVIFCSSGTTGDIKLMIFDGFNMVNQLNASKKMPKENLNIIYPQKIRPLRIAGLIPFHHIFAFVSIFLWYSFYGATIVFTDFNDPVSLVKEIRDFEITHIYHVPLFYEVVAKNYFKQLDKRYKEKVKNVIKYNLGLIGFRDVGLGVRRTKKAIKSNIFGKQIRYLISGGGYLSDDISRTINGLGYPLYNGYGMTEIGVTSVELSPYIEDRIKRSIGHPLNQVSYKLSPKNELLVKSPTIHVREIINGKEINTAFTRSGYFATGDIAKVDKDGRYYLIGRAKEVIISSNGENVYPEEIESYFKKIKGIVNLAVFSYQRKIVMVVETNNPDAGNHINLINSTLPLHKQVNQIVLTNESLPLASNLKIKRFLVKRNYAGGVYKKTKFTKKKIDILAGYDSTVRNNVIKRLNKVYRKVLFVKKDVDGNAHWINDIHSDSMTYITLINEIEKEFSIKIPIEKYGQLTTLNEFAKQLLDSGCK